MPKIPEWDGKDDGQSRCHWAVGSWLAPYHDEEWGVPIHDDAQHFELLVLEGAQAGLSWLTVLKRRQGYRRAFANFNPAVVARFSPQQVEGILGDPGVIRHRGKIEAAIGNAIAFLHVQEESGSFDDYIWGFVGGNRIINGWHSPDQVPGTTPLSAALSIDLKRRGFRYVGPIICYAYLQAAGLVMDHLTGCFRYQDLVKTTPPHPISGGSQ